MPELAVATHCCECGREAAKPAPPRLPRAWKRKGDAVYCGVCWRKHYVLRAIALPVASPLGLEWKQLAQALKPMWAATTSCSNWMMTELYARDVRRHGEAKMPPMANVYLYPEARKRFPELPSQTVAALEQAVKGRYRAKRYEVVWTASASLPTHRYPTPFPVHNQSWSIAREEQALIVSLRIGQERMRLRLKQGPQYRRQMIAANQMIAGTAVRGELALYRQGRSLMCKMVAWLPREERPETLTGELRVRTETDGLLVALNTKDERLWRYNGDHLRRWIAEHRRQLQRWSEDQKAEQRPQPRFAERRRLSAEKFRHRMQSACHEVAAELAGYARRRCFAKVHYDDRVKDFAGEAFPYFRLRQLIEEKVEAFGIEFKAVSAAEEEKPLAGE